MPHDRPACPAWGMESNWTPEAPSVRRARADCRGRLFTAKLGIVLHYLPHQMFDHLLADDPLLLACQFCDRLRDRIDDFVRFTGIDFVRACLSYSSMWSQEPVHVGGGGRNYSRAGETVARSTEAHAAAVRSAISGIRR